MSGVRIDNGFHGGDEGYAYGVEQQFNICYSRGYERIGTKIELYLCFTIVF